MTSSICIYGLFDPRSPDVVMYVGKGAERRAKSHWKNFLQKGTAGNALLRRWLAKLQQEGVTPSWFFLEENVADWQARERDCIQTWRVINPDLCNVADGGNQVQGLGGAARKGQRLTEEHRERIRKAHLRENMSLEYRQNLSAGVRRSWKNGRIFPREKIRAALLGRPRSSEARKACSLGQKLMSLPFKLNRAAQASRIAHTRWHTKKGVLKPEICKLCREA